MNVLDISVVAALLAVLYFRPLALVRAILKIHRLPPTVIYPSSPVAPESLPVNEARHFGRLERELAALGFVSHGLYARAAPISSAAVTTRVAQLFLTHPASGAVCDAAIVRTQGGAAKSIERRVLIFQTRFDDGREVIVSNSIRGAVCKGMKHRIGVGIDGLEEVAKLYAVHAGLVARARGTVVIPSAQDPLALIEARHAHGIRQRVDAGLMRMTPDGKGYAKTWRGSVSFTVPAVEPCKEWIEWYRRWQGEQALRLSGGGRERDGS